MTSQTLTALRPWTRLKRKPAVQGRAAGGAEWVYLTSANTGAGREHVTARVERLALPQACDQCSQLIPPGVADGARSFKVSRGLSPTTLYLCGTCVNDLCEAGGIPAPAPGE